MPIAFQNLNWTERDAILPGSGPESDPGLTLLPSNPVVLAKVLLESSCISPLLCYFPLPDRELHRVRDQGRMERTRQMR